MSDQVFPEVTSESDNPDNNNVTAIWSKGGLTKRELFAAMAMEGQIAYMADWNILDPGSVAKRSVVYADALLKELSKNEET